MKELLINTLSEFGYPVLLQGSIQEEEEYPNTFFTFWENDSYDGTHYDNKPLNCIGDFDVNIYSVDPTIVNTKLLDVKNELIKKGFIISGNGYDVASDEPSHTGRGMNLLKVER